MEGCRGRLRWKVSATIVGFVGSHWADKVNIRLILTLTSLEPVHFSVFPEHSTAIGQRQIILCLTLTFVKIPLLGNVSVIEPNARKSRGEVEIQHARLF